MERLELAGWVLECDPESTRRALAQVPEGAAEACGCLSCRNFAAARDHAYSPAMRGLLRQLGVAVDREAEVYEVGPAERWGFRLYCGWFHAVGRIVRDPLLDEAPAGRPFASLGSTFKVYFARGGALVPEAFAGQPVVQLEFEVEIPWVLAEPAPID